MNKQCNIFSGDTLDPIEKHELEKERRNNIIVEFLGDVKVIEDKKEKVKEIRERDFIRTLEDIFQVKYKMRGFLVSTSIITKKETWVEEKAVKKSSVSFLGVLKCGDKLLLRNDNGILLEAFVFKVYKNKKGVCKIVVHDVRDNETLCFESENVVRLLEIFKERSNYVKSITKK